MVHQESSYDEMKSVFDAAGNYRTRERFLLPVDHDGNPGSSSADESMSESSDNWSDPIDGHWFAEDDETISFLVKDSSSSHHVSPLFHQQRTLGGVDDLWSVAVEHRYRSPGPNDPWRGHENLRLKLYVRRPANVDAEAAEPSLTNCARHLTQQKPISLSWVILTSPSFPLGET